MAWDQSTTWIRPYTTSTQARTTRSGPCTASSSSLCTQIRLQAISACKISMQSDPWSALWVWIFSSRGAALLPLIPSYQIFEKHGPTCYILWLSLQRCYHKNDMSKKKKKESIDLAGTYISATQMQDTNKRKDIFCNVEMFPYFNNSKHAHENCRSLFR